MSGLRGGELPSIGGRLSRGAAAPAARSPTIDYDAEDDAPTRSPSASGFNKGGQLSSILQRNIATLRQNLRDKDALLAHLIRTQTNAALHAELQSAPTRASDAANGEIERLRRQLLEAERRNADMTDSNTALRARCKKALDSAELMLSQLMATHGRLQAHEAIANEDAKLLAEAFELGPAMGDIVAVKAKDPSVVPDAVNPVTGTVDVVALRLGAQVAVIVNHNENGYIVQYLTTAKREYRVPLRRILVLYRRLQDDIQTQAVSGGSGGGRSPGSIATATSERKGGGDAQYSPVISPLRPGDGTAAAGTGNNAAATGIGGIGRIKSLSAFMAGGGVAVPLLKRSQTAGGADSPEDPDEFMVTLARRAASFRVGVFPAAGGSLSSPADATGAKGGPALPSYTDALNSKISIARREQGGDEPWPASAHSEDSGELFSLSGAAHKHLHSSPSAQSVHTVGSADSSMLESVPVEATSSTAAATHNRPTSATHWGRHSSIEQRLRQGSSFRSASSHSPSRPPVRVRPLGMLSSSSRTIPEEAEVAHSARGNNVSETGTGDASGTAPLSDATSTSKTTNAATGSVASHGGPRALNMKARPHSADPGAVRKGVIPLQVPMSGLAANGGRDARQPSGSVSERGAAQNGVSLTAHLGGSLTERGAAQRGGVAGAGKGTVPAITELEDDKYKPAILGSLYQAYSKLRKEHVLMRETIERLKAELMTLQEGWRLANPMAFIDDTTTPGLQAARAIVLNSASTATMGVGGGGSPLRGSGPGRLPAQRAPKVTVKDDDDGSGWSSGGGDSDASLTIPDLFGEGSIGRLNGSVLKGKSIARGKAQGGTGRKR